MKLIRGLATLAALFAVLCAGVWLGANPDRLPGAMRELLADSTGSLTAEAAGLIEANYFREVDQEQLSNGSVHGMVRAIGREHDDRFSHYFDPEAMERFGQALSGSFSGVGLTVTEVPRGLRVARVIAGAPAAAAGIKVGELIVSVDGEPIAGQNVEEVTARIKGPEGTEVTLGVEPADGGRVRRLEIVRSEVRLPPTRAGLRERQGRQLGYIEFATFSTGAHAFVRNSVERLQERGAEGIVIDLRGNGGGLLTEAILTAGLFIPEGETIVSTQSRSEGERVYESPGDNIEHGPLVVLINGDTASAAEILAAALSTDLKVPLVGSRTYGKGVFQKVIDLSNGGALDLTIGEYLTADGVSLANKGLQPDVRAADESQTRPDEALERGFEVLIEEIEEGQGATVESAVGQPAGMAAS